MQLGEQGGESKPQTSARDERMVPAIKKNVKCVESGLRATRDAGAIQCQMEERGEPVAMVVVVTGMADLAIIPPFLVRGPGFCCVT